MCDLSVTHARSSTLSSVVVMFLRGRHLCRYTAEFFFFPFYKTSDTVELKVKLLLTEHVK